MRSIWTPEDYLLLPRVWIEAAEALPTPTVVPQRERELYLHEAVSPRQHRKRKRRRITPIVVRTIFFFKYHLSTFCLLKINFVLDSSLSSVGMIIPEADTQGK